MRYNIFNNIHKGLRASLFQTAQKIQQTDFLMEEEAEEAVNRIREVVMLFDGHADKEDQFLLPMISAYEPSVVDAFASEHEEDVELGLQLIGLIEKLAASESLQEKVKTGQEISAAFMAFTAFNLQHMAKEEDLLNKLLWRYYSDDELQEISKQAVASTPPWINAFYSTWMLRGLNTRETINWLKTVETHAPKMVFEDLLAASERELSPASIQRVRRALAGTEVLA